MQHFKSSLNLNFCMSECESFYMVMFALPEVSLKRHYVCMYKYNCDFDNTAATAKSVMYSWPYKWVIRSEYHSFLLALVVKQDFTSKCNKDKEYYLSPFIGMRLITSSMIKVMSYSLLSLHPVVIKLWSCKLRVFIWYLGN